MVRVWQMCLPESVCDYLKNEIPAIHRGILDRIVEHKIDGEVFLSLNDEYLREVAPLLGDRLKIRCVLNSLLLRYSTVIQLQTILILIYKLLHSL